MALGNTPRGLTYIALEANKSFALDVRYATAAGAAFDLTDYVVRIVAEAPRNLGGADVITMTAEQIATDKVQFRLQAADLDLEPGDYPFDITTVNPDGYSIPTIKGIFAIGPNADDDSTNIYASANPSGGLLATIGGGNEVVVKMEMAPGIKGDKGDTGPTGAPGGVYVKPVEPQAGDTMYRLWVDTSDLVV